VAFGRPLARTRHSTRKLAAHAPASAIPVQTRKVAVSQPPDNDQAGHEGRESAPREFLEMQTKRQSNEKSSDWTWRRWHWWVLLAALLIRIAVGVVVDRESSFAGWDGKEYYAYAHSLLTLHGDSYPRYFNLIRPAGYPIFLIPFVAISNNIWPIQIAQAFIGTFQAWLLGSIACRWRGQRSGNISFVITLFNPFLIYYCAFILTETLFMALLWGALLSLQRFHLSSEQDSNRRLLLSAILLALASLTRPSLQPFLLVSLLWIGWRTWTKSSSWEALKKASAFGALSCALIVPFMFHNWLTHSTFSLAPNNWQVVYAQGNSSDYLLLLRAQTKSEYYSIQDRLHSHFSIESGTGPQEWMTEAREFSQSNAHGWWLLQLYKLKHFWTPWLNPIIFSRTQFLLSLFFTTPLFVLAFLELWRRRHERDPFMLLLLGLVGVGYLVGGFLFHVQVRYRIPFVDVTFLILTASFLARFDLKQIRFDLHSYVNALRERRVVMISDL